MSIWKKIKGLFIPASESEEDDDSNDLDFTGFRPKEPIDVTFTKNFIANNGAFFYCENDQEILKNIKEIAENEQQTEFICFDEKLQSLLSRAGVRFTTKINEPSDFVFIECEYLNAYDGSIMLSSHQMKGQKLDSLPKNIIVYSTPKQLVTNLNEAMQRLNSEKGGNFPSITSIRGKGVNSTYSTDLSKKIYLLLVEKHK
ncbi:MAG: LUD domain-containing protein [Weeksellaceae bacterium]|nr:LUD domain-containing protein [Weeksellaceae bacterium]